MRYAKAHRYLNRPVTRGDDLEIQGLHTAALKQEQNQLFTENVTKYFCSPLGGQANSINTSTLFFKGKSDNIFNVSGTLVISILF